MSKKKALKGFLGILLTQFILIAGIVWVFDPFYQYHEPFFGIQKVLYDRDNQVPGTIRTFEYDSVILGSSVTENYDSEYWNKMMDCTSLQIVRAGGSTADLLYYLRQAHEEQKLKSILWSIDIFALNVSTEVTLYGKDIPRYLHTKTILDDIPYLYNKEVLFNKIPMTLAYSHLDTYTKGQGYEWSSIKEFGADKAMRAYIKPDKALESQDFSDSIPLIQENIQMVKEEITAHPEIQYTIVFPPYSLMYWDSAYVNGIGEQYFYILDEIMKVLLEFDNVKIYYFQADRDIVCDLNNYMDIVHFTGSVNQFMLEAIEKDEYRVTKENVDTVLSKMRDTYEYIYSEGIYQYYPRQE